MNGEEDSGEKPEGEKGGGEEQTKCFYCYLMVH